MVRYRQTLISRRLQEPLAGQSYSMSDSFLLSRALLQFDSDLDDLIGEISAIAFTPDGSLWLGSDELLTIERLSPISPGIYGQH